jgi:hypothetical protein
MSPVLGAINDAKYILKGNMHGENIPQQTTLKEHHSTRLIFGAKATGGNLSWV